MSGVGDSQGGKRRMNLHCTFSVENVSVSDVSTKRRRKIARGEQKCLEIIEN